MRRLVAVCCAAGLSAPTAPSTAQSYPAKPIRLLVGFAAGSGTDLIGRVVAQKMADNLGRQVIVDNRPGAGANIAAELAAKAPPDGYTMLIANTGIAISASAFAKINYSLARDLVPVSQVASAPHILLTHPSLPPKSVQELIQFARARPGTLNFTSAGVGNSDHLAAEMFKHMAGIQIVHVPNKGGPQAASDLIAGQVEIFFAGLPVGLPLAKAGKVRALAVTSGSRWPAAPDIPTMHEAGVNGYEHTLWAIIFVSSGTPRDIIARLNAEVVEAVHAPAVRERLASMGVEAVSNSTEQVGAYVSREAEKYAKLVKAIGLRIE